MTIRVVRVRKRWQCAGSCERWIEPGELARATILFPGNDVWQNATPWHGRECKQCARRFGRWPA